MNHSQTATPHLKPEIQAYQHALAVWEHFHNQSRGLEVSEDYLTRAGSPDYIADRFLHLLPPDERTPVAFGLFLCCAQNWRPLRQTSFLGEFLPGPSQLERRILEAAARGVLRRPRKVAVTVEEFPSRIWKRALASGCPERLVSAGYLSIRAILSLHAQHEDDTDLEDLMTFRIPSGDLPGVIDLAALSPVGFLDLKTRIVDRMMDEILAERFEISLTDFPAIKAWVLVDTEERGTGVEQLAAEARASMAECLITGSLRAHHHTRRLGRLMFRFGLRRLSSQCAKVLGYSPWRIGWQFQAISGTVHSRIRRIILSPDSDVDAWMREPALACSAMSLPLWLVDGVDRVSELTALFDRAEECPWMFPRLQHIYQWHLALAGKHDELRKIEQLAPDLAVGLSEKPSPAIP